MDHVDYVYTSGMSEAEITTKLQESLAGVLSLASASRAYAVPVSHTFDGERLYLRLTNNGNSTKMSMLEDTEMATFTVYETDGAEDAWSISVHGRLSPVPDLDDTTMNELFEPLHVFDEDIEDLSVEVYELEFDSITGRKTVQ